MGDINAPSWLQESSATPSSSLQMSGVRTEIPGVLGGSTTSSATPSISLGNGSAAAAPSASTTTTTIEADEAELPSIILIMRLANMGVAGVMMACSIILMIGIPPISGFVLAIYATCGAVLICCLETQLKFLRTIIAVNFGFLFNSIWRFLFYMLMGSVAWSYNSLFGKIVAICFGAVALFNTYVLCRYPGYRKIREKIADEEDKRIEARISKEVRRQANQQILAGSAR